MKKLIAFVLALVCVSGLAGCRLNHPDFDDFEEYKDDFVLIKDFIIDFKSTDNDDSLHIVDINSQFLSINGSEISDNSMEAAVKSVYDKGFTYIEINKDYIIFWEDETGYYGVLWSKSPRKAINNFKDTRPYSKSRKLANEWYEVGALDAI